MQVEHLKALRTATNKCIEDNSKEDEEDQTRLMNESNKVFQNSITNLESNTAVAPGVDLVCTNLFVQQRNPKNIS